MTYKAWAVEVHIGMYVFTHEFKEEQTARKCFERTALATQHELRLWLKSTLKSQRDVLC